MNDQLSMNESERIIMETEAQKKIKEMKAIKEEYKITYDDIMVEMEKLDSSKVVSLSTLRRIFRDGSEQKASSFNYEEIILPAYNAVKALDKKPSPSSPFELELQGYKNVIRVQNEELDRLLELKEHLDSRVDFLVERINFLTEQVKQKHEMITKLMEKCL